MDQEIKIQPPYVIELESIPERIYNKILTQETRERLATGRESSLIKDIVIDGEPPKDAKLTASKNEEGKTVITFDYLENDLKLPKEILGTKLNNDQLDKLFYGELLSLTYKGQQYYVGMDKDLNKITVKSNAQIGIPDKIQGYSLTWKDQLEIANGKATDTHLFKTKEGDIYTARFKMTEDRKGIVFEDIKFVSPENAKELELKYNRESLEQKGKIPPDPLLEKELLAKFKSFHPEIQSELRIESAADWLNHRPDNGKLAKINDPVPQEKHDLFIMKNFKQYEPYITKFAEQYNLPFKSPSNDGKAVEAFRLPQLSPTQKLDMLPTQLKLELLSESREKFLEHAESNLPGKGKFSDQQERLDAHADFAVKNYKNYETHLVEYAKEVNVEFVSDNVVKKWESVEPISKNIVPSQPEKDSVGKSDRDVIFQHGRPERQASIDKSSAGPSALNHPSVIYTNVNSRKDGFTIEATDYFSPKTLKGVVLSEDQRSSIARGEKTLVEGMELKDGRKASAYVQIKTGPDGKNGFDFDYKIDGNKKGPEKSVSKAKDDDFKIER